MNAKGWKVAVFMGVSGAIEVPPGLKPAASNLVLRRAFNISQAARDCQNLWKTLTTINI